MKALLKERRISVLVFPCVTSLILSAYIVRSVLAAKPLYGTRMMIASAVITLAWSGIFLADLWRIRSGKNRKTLRCSLPTALIPAVLLGLYFAYAVWGSRYLTLAPMEQIDNGTQKLDSLFHSALSESFRRSLLPSTLLNSEGYIPYHSFSHLLMSIPSRILQTPALVTYCYLYPALFIPTYLYAQMTAVLAVKDYFSDRAEIRLRDLAIIILFNVGFLYDPWLDAHGVWKRQAVYSESYFIAALLAFLSCGIIFRLLKNPGTGRKRMRWLLFLVIPASIFLITWCKISTGLLFTAAVMYFVFRKHLKEIRFWGINMLYGCVFLLALWLFNMMGGGYQPAEQTLIRPLAFRTYCPGTLGIFGHWLILMILPAGFIFLEIIRLRKEQKVFVTGKTVWIEMILLIALIAFLPGAVMVIEGGSAAFFAWTVEIPGLLLLTGHPLFNAEQEIRLPVRRTAGILCMIWCAAMCWINKADDPMKYVTGQHASGFSSMLTEVRDRCGQHPEQYTVYLDPDNIGLEVFQPIALAELRTSYVWPAVTGAGVINATYQDDGILRTYRGNETGADFGAQYTDNDHAITLEEALEKAAARGKKAVIHVTADGYEVLECGK